MAEKVNTKGILSSIQLDTASAIIDRPPLSKVFENLFGIRDVLHSAGLDNDGIHTLIYQELQKHPLELEEALSFSEYALHRFQRHTEGSVYQRKYLQSDFTLTEIPGKIASIPGPTQERTARVVTFFDLATFVTRYQELNGNRFVEDMKAGLGHIAYIHALPEDMVQILIALEGYRGNRDAYDSHLITIYTTSPSVEKKAIALSESNRLDALRKYEREHDVDLLDIFRYVKQGA